MRVPRPGKPVDKPGRPSLPVRPGPRLGIKEFKAKQAEKRALKASKPNVTIMPVPNPGKPGKPNRGKLKPLRPIVGNKIGRPVPPKKVR